MKLVLKPVTAADLKDAARYYDDSTTGTLWPPAFDAYCRPSDEADKRACSEWVAQRQIEQLENDPTIRFMQVIDQETDQPVSFGQWHYYPTGFHDTGDLEAIGTLDRNDPATWPNSLSKDEWLDFWRQAFAIREIWFQDEPCWCLTTLKTRKPLRGGGAGGLIVDWGVAQARAMAIPARLQAAQSSKGLYEKHGFREEGTREIIAFGSAFTLAQMKAS